MANVSACSVFPNRHTPDDRESVCFVNMTDCDFACRSKLKVAGSNHPFSL